MSGYRSLNIIAVLGFIRFPLVFVAIADSAAGFLYTPPVPEEIYWGFRTGPRLPLVLLAVISSGLCFFGMGLKDYRDRFKDAASAPHKVLPSGRLSLPIARGILAATLSLSLVSLAILTAAAPEWRRAAWWVSLIAWFQVLLSILVYDCFWRNPLAMGLVRTALFGLGVSIMHQSDILSNGLAKLLNDTLLPSLALLVFCASLTWVSLLEDDAHVDRRKIAIRCGGMFLGYALAVIAGGLHPWTWGIAVLGCSWLLRRVIKAVDKAGLMLLIRDGIAGCILLDACLVGTRQPIYCLYFLALLLPAYISSAVMKRLAR